MSNTDQSGNITELFNVIARSEIVLDRGPDDNAPETSGLVFDVAKYLGYVEGEDLSDTEAKALLGAIWQIVVAFVDLGFGLHPVQQTMDKSKMLKQSETSDVLSLGSVHSDTKTIESEERSSATRGERIHEPG